MEGDVVTLQDLFAASSSDLRTNGGLLGSLEPTNLRPGFLSKLKANGVDLGPSAWSGAE
jgi:pilus assembly protein CpaF